MCIPNGISSDHTQEGTTRTKEVLARTVERLASSTDSAAVFGAQSLPSYPALKEVVQLCRAVIFPDYYGSPAYSCSTLSYRIGVEVERLMELLSEQIALALLHLPEETSARVKPNAIDLARRFIEQLPELRRLLMTDVEATYLGDPAATSFEEVIFCYPTIKAVSCYRVAHALHCLGIPLLPRIISEMAHGETGIDIHPAAQIGHHFTIDHGTGTVIGATCIIGNNVKLYQGVTLGAKSFPLDADGNPIKHILRHPILEDDVIVYANATILGRVTIGRGVVVGGNQWVTSDLLAPAN